VNLFPNLRKNRSAGTKGTYSPIPLHRIIKARMNVDYSLQPSAVGFAARSEGGFFLRIGWIGRFPALLLGEELGEMGHLSL